MTVGELMLLLNKYDSQTHAAIVWPERQRAAEEPWIAEIEKLLVATEIETGEVDLLMEAVEMELPDTPEHKVSHGPL